MHTKRSFLFSSWCLEQLTLQYAGPKPPPLSYHGIISNGVWYLCTVNEATPDELRACVLTQTTTKTFTIQSSSLAVVKHGWKDHKTSSEDYDSSYLQSSYKYSTNCKQRMPFSWYCNNIKFQAESGGRANRREEKISIHHRCLWQRGMSSNTFIKLRTIKNCRRHLNTQVQMLRYLKLLHCCIVKMKKNTCSKQTLQRKTVPGICD